jgi:hypothetical protein
MGKYKLTFYEEQHQYSIETPEGNVLLDSVTTILTEMGITKYWNEANAETYQSYGINGHAMIRLDLDGTLDLSSVDPGLQKPFWAWRKFRLDFPHLIPVKDDKGHLSERPMYSDVYRYAGTPDLIFRNRITGDLWEIDIKFSDTVMASWELQTAGYCPLIREEMGLRQNSKILRYAITFSPMSNLYHLHRLADSHSEVVFHACRIAYNWKKTRGLIKHGGFDIKI